MADNLPQIEVILARVRPLIQQALTEACIPSRDWNEWTEVRARVLELLVDVLNVIDEGRGS